MIPFIEVEVIFITSIEIGEVNIFNNVPLQT